VLRAILVSLKLPACEESEYIFKKFFAMSVNEEATQNVQAPENKASDELGIC
jgi:hypothetical protein